MRVTLFGTRGSLAAPGAETNRYGGNTSTIDHGATLMYAFTFIPLTLIQCGNYAAVKLLVHEAIALAKEKGALNWTAY